jgi:hypothetical protein
VTQCLYQIWKSDSISFKIQEDYFNKIPFFFYFVHEKETCSFGFDCFEKLKENPKALLNILIDSLCSIFAFPFSIIEKGLNFSFQYSSTFIQIYLKWSQLYVKLKNI